MGRRRGEPGDYNLAADGEVTLREVAEATGTRSVPVPRALAVAASAAVARLPLMPAAAEWVHIARTSVVMDTHRAKAVLGWQPRHTSRETLDELAAVL